MRMNINKSLLSKHSIGDYNISRIYGNYKIDEEPIEESSYLSRTIHSKSISSG